MVFLSPEVIGVTRHLSHFPVSNFTPLKQSPAPTLSVPVPGGFIFSADHRRPSRPTLGSAQSLRFHVRAVKCQRFGFSVLSVFPIGADL